MLKKFDGLNASVQENLIGIRVVKAFVREDHENEKFRKTANDLCDASVKAENMLIYNMPLMQFVMYACMVAISWFGGNMIIRGTMETGQLMSFISYVSQILISLMMISMAFVMLVISRASIVRIVEILDEDIDVKDDQGDPGLKLNDGSIVFDNVSFSYCKDKDHLNLDNINFEIKSGETIGIIGGTGSAKTTLVQLIPRLYDVTGGRIIVGGNDVRDYTFSNLRDEVSMVLQKNVLFSGTIKENLKWGNENATDEQIVEACKAAQAYDFIMSFPDGLETMLGQGGVNVSGGQSKDFVLPGSYQKA